MRRERGSTLVEAMIAASLVGIAVGVAGDAALQDRREAGLALARERAGLVLEAEARRLVQGTPEDPAALARLTADLPEAKVTVEKKAGLATVTVRWRGRPGTPESRSLTVFTKGGP